METPFLGRSDEVDQLRSLAKEVIGGKGGAVLVLGEPGIGKSALLTAGLADVTALGGQVLRGTGDEMGSRFPARALLQCLEAGGGEDIRIGARPLARGYLRGRPAVGVIDSLIALVDRQRAISPLVLVLDDLQWADEASLRAWRRLSRMAQRTPLLLAAACRPVPRRPELAFLREDITAGIVASIRLGPLSDEHVAELVTAVAGNTPEPRLQRLAGLAGGNPRYVQDVVAAMREEPTGADEQMDDAYGGAGTTAARNGARSLPPSLAATIMDRLGFLSEEATRVLRMAALLGVEFPLSDLNAVVGTVGKGLEEACAAGVLTATHGRFVFRHRLIQLALYEATPASLRSALHRHAAEAMAISTVPAERVARHLLAAPDAMDGWVLNWLAAEGPELTRREPRMSATLHQQALEHVPADDIRRERMECSLAAAWRMLAHFDDLERLTRQALARACGPEHAGRMTWLRALALMHVQPVDGLNLTAGPRLGAGLDERWAARLGALRALLLGATGRLDEVNPAAEQALATANQIEDRMAAGYALHAMAVAASRFDTGRAIALIAQALAAAGDDPEAAELRLVLLSDQTRAFDYLGMRTEADEALWNALALAGGSSTSRQVGVELHAATHWFETGNWDGALSALDMIEAIPGEGEFPVRLHGLCALIAGHRDDRDTVRRHLAELHRKSISDEVMRRHGQHVVMARALAAEREGQPERALTLLARQFGPERNVDLGLGSYYGLAEMVRLALALNNHAFAWAVVDAATADARRYPRSLRRAAVANRCRGLLSSDPALLLDAAEYFRAANEPFELAATLEDAADVHGERGDVTGARVAFSTSVTTYLGLGAAWDIRRAEWRVRPYGIGRGQRGPRRRPAVGLDSLTPTELKVARLVAKGHSNPEIAAELFLSARTVQSHVSHILAKLEARSRGEIARSLEQASQAEQPAAREGLAS